MFNIVQPVVETPIKGLPYIDLLQEFKGRGTFTRASAGTWWDGVGKLKEAAVNEARFTNAPNAGDYQGLLIAEARPNLVLQSEDVNTTWLQSAVVVTSNTTVAPDGNTTADTITRTNTANNNYVYQNVTKAASALTYTYSVYAKAGAGDFLAIRIQGLYPARADVCFDLSDGSISTAASVGTGFTSPSATITDVGGGYYRCTITATSDTHTTVTSYMSARSITGQIDTIGSNATASVIVWGSQLEQASTASSYIPTTTASALGAADIATLPWSRIEGTYVIEYDNVYVGTGWRLFELNRATPVSSDFIFLGGANPTGFIQASIGIASVGITANSAIPPDGLLHKIALRLEAGNNECYLDGVSIANAAFRASNLTTNLSLMNIGGSAFSSARYLNGHIKVSRKYQTGITNVQLQELTS